MSIGSSFRSAAPRSLYRKMRLLLALLLLALAACQVSPQREEPIEAAEVVVETPPPEETLTPAERVRKAILALETGDKTTARRQLKLALEEKPRLGVANGLLQQMDADPIAALGAEYSIYHVAAGDSLANIAREKLGDALKFVILARYNNIDNPSLLKRGQPLRIPGRQQQPPPESTVETLAQESGEMETAPPVTTAPESEPEDSGPAPTASGDTDVPTEAPAAPTLQAGAEERDVEEHNAEVQRLFRRGLELAQANRLAEAYSALSQAYAGSPADAAITEAYLRSRVRLTDSYHRQAMQHFRKHELDDAIGFWDKILSLDPDHKLAPGYRARAIELRSKLRKIAQ